MNTKLSLSAAALVLASFGATCLAQNPNPPAAPAAALAAVESRARDRIISLGKLPTPAELTQDAAARNASIVRMEQTDKRIVVFYQTPGGTITADAYELMSTAGVPVAPSVPTAPTVSTVPTAPPAPVLSTPTAPVVTTAGPCAPTTVVVPASPAPPLVYYEYPASSYYYSYPSYYPAYYGYPSWGYAPIGINLSFGWRGGVGYGGGFRGGYRGGYRFHR